MDELTLDDELYLSTKRAAKITGYAKDYVGQLCREGRVKARLVGRNWYVLDSSIREHRFGAEGGESTTAPEDDPAPKEVSMSQAQPEIKADPMHVAASAAPTDWQPVQYMPEKVSEMVVIGQPQDTFADHSSTEESESIPDTTSVVQEMQSAWQDWFKRKDEEKVLAETLLETPEIVDEREGFSTFHSEVVAPMINSNEEMESHFEVTAEKDEEEVNIPIRRTYEPVPAVTRAQEAAEEEYVPVEARRTTKRGKPLKQSHRSPRTGFALAAPIRVFFILVMLISIGMAILGSGLVDNSIRRDSAAYYPLQYLGGQSVFEKK